MAWLQLTTDNEETVLIDSEKVLQIRPHAKGSHITMTTILPNKDGKPSLKTLVSSQTPEGIAKALKATAVRR
ncbi:hypothetical protein [Shinella sp. M31]|uniref:hypothetical protein n=1 Tax=Shinella sp. M31 TaxID=3368615 RepID=UPI003B9DD47F